MCKEGTIHSSTSSGSLVHSSPFHGEATFSSFKFHWWMSHAHSISSFKFSLVFKLSRMRSLNVRIDTSLTLLGLFYFIDSYQNNFWVRPFRLLDIDKSNAIQYIAT